MLSDKYSKVSNLSIAQDELFNAAKDLVNHGWLISAPSISTVGSELCFFIDYSYTKCGSKHSLTHKYAKLFLDPATNKVLVEDIPFHYLQNKRLYIHLDSPSNLTGDVTFINKNIELSDSIHNKLLKARKYLLDEEIYTRVLQNN